MPHSHGETSLSFSVIVDEQSQLLRHQHCLRATSDMQFAKNTTHMGFGRDFRNAEAVGNLAITHALTNHGEYLNLTVSEGNAVECRAVCESTRR